MSIQQLKGTPDQPLSRQIFRFANAYKEGDVLWVYYQYCLARGDTRSRQDIYADGKKRSSKFNPVEYRNDYIGHPFTGEQLTKESIATLEKVRQNWRRDDPDVVLVISDGLNAKAIMDPGHLMPYLKAVRQVLSEAGLNVAEENIVVSGGRVRAGYQIGGVLFEKAEGKTSKAVVHIIGERPGTIHRNYSVYLASPKVPVWANRQVDHDMARVISGISDTALDPVKAAEMTVKILKEMIILGK